MGWRSIVRLPGSGSRRGCCCPWGEVDVRYWLLRPPAKRLPELWLREEAEGLLAEWLHRGYRLDLDADPTECVERPGSWAAPPIRRARPYRRHR